MYVYSSVSILSFNHYSPEPHEPTPQPSFLGRGSCHKLEMIRSISDNPPEMNLHTPEDCFQRLVYVLAFPFFTQGKWGFKPKHINIFEL